MGILDKLKALKDQPQSPGEALDAQFEETIQEFHRNLTDAESKLAMLIAEEKRLESEWQTARDAAERSAENRAAAAEAGADELISKSKAELVGHRERVSKAKSEWEAVRQQVDERKRQLERDAAVLETIKTERTLSTARENHKQAAREVAKATGTMELIERVTQALEALPDEDRDA